jgi:intracellular septation protein
MNASTLLFGILPLLAFVVIDCFAGLRSGVIAAVIFAVAEAAYTLWEFGTIDIISIGTLALVLVFGLTSYKLNNAIYIKLQPVFLGVLFGLALLVAQFLGKPLLVTMMDKYQAMLPEDMRSHLANPAVRITMAKLSGILGYGFIMHASLVAYAAFRMSTWWWLFMRGVGVYVMMALCVLVTRATTD